MSFFLDFLPTWLTPPILLSDSDRHKKCQNLLLSSSVVPSSRRRFFISRLFLELPFLSISLFTLFWSDSSVSHFPASR